MSNFIVLVKQVPDITQIADDAFDTETGTLIRSRLASVINELDTQALAFADRMRQAEGGKGKVICLTMGPAMAAEVLRYSLARCADAAVLLSDSQLAGADTLATANPLAFAIRKIAKEFFGGDGNYFVITGMQSVDGDTAQVPPQIAQELGVPCVAYATDVWFKAGRFEFERISSGGTETVRPKKIPAVITVAQYAYPLFAGFGAARKAGRCQIVTWSASDTGADAIGINGSRTRVIRVFAPGKSSRKCQKTDNVKELAEAVVERFKQAAEGDQEQWQEELYCLPAKRQGEFLRNFEATGKENEDYRILGELLEKLSISEIGQVDEPIKKKILEAAGGCFHKQALENMLEGLKRTAPSYSGQVWVYAEHRNGRVVPAAFELTGKARQLADSLETKAGVCLAGSRVQPMTSQLIACGADDVYVIDDPLLAVFDPAGYRKAVADCISRYSPQIVLFAATAQGRVLAPMVSYSLKCGLTADCTSLQIRDSSRRGQIGILLQTRPALGGNVMASICTKDSKIQMATVRPAVFKAPPADNKRSGKIIEHSVKLTDSDISLEIIKTEQIAGSADLNAEVIVSGGRGMHSRDNYERLVGSLCNCLTEKLGTKVERAASRAAVERGFIERIHQVGQTGTAVGPKLYIALGISGAVQHMIGLSNAGTIIAVNSDPDAPIFKQCDYYITGPVEQIVPELVEAIEGLTESGR